MIRSVRPPFFFNWFDPDHLICRVPPADGADRRIYLTFDDGPVPEATPRVLEILKQHGAKATFFMVGDNILKHPSLYEQVVSAGHAVGNHTFHHLNGWKTDTAAYAEDVMRFDALHPTPLFRPPYGRFTPSQYLMLRKRFLFVMWSVLTWDFSPKITPEECYEKTIRHMGPGEIVVFHDHPKAMPRLEYVLPRFLEECHRRNLQLALLDVHQINPSSAKLK